MFVSKCNIFLNIIILHIYIRSQMLRLNFYLSWVHYKESYRHNGLKPNMQKHKVENIKEDILDSITSPSHSVKIQIIGGNIYLR